MFPSCDFTRCTERSSLFWQHRQTQGQARSCTSHSVSYSNSSAFSMFAYKVTHFKRVFRSRLWAKLSPHFQIPLRAKNEHSNDFLLCHRTPVARLKSAMTLSWCPGQKSRKVGRGLNDFSASISWWTVWVRSRGLINLHKWCMSWLLGTVTMESPFSTTSHSLCTFPLCFKYWIVPPGDTDWSFVLVIYLIAFLFSHLVCCLLFQGKMCSAANAAFPFE